MKFVVAADTSVWCVPADMEVSMVAVEPASDALSLNEPASSGARISIGNGGGSTRTRFPGGGGGSMEVPAPPGGGGSRVRARAEPAKHRLRFPTSPPFSAPYEPKQEKKREDKIISDTLYPAGRRRDGHGLLAVEGHSRSLRQHPRAPHAYFAAPVFRGRRAVKYMYSDVGIHQNSEEEERTDGELN